MDCTECRACATQRGVNASVSCPLLLLDGVLLGGEEKVYPASAFLWAPQVGMGSSTITKDPL